MTIFASKFEQFKSKFWDPTGSELSNRVPSTRRTCRPAAETGFVLLQTALVVAAVCLRKIASWCQVIGIEHLIADRIGGPFIFPGVVRTRDLPKKGFGHVDET